MFIHTHVWVGIACFTALSLLFALILWRCYCHKPREATQSHQIVRTDSSTERLQSGIAKLHQEGFLRHGHHHHQVQGFTDSAKRSSRGNNYVMFRRGASGKPLFSWSDHPSLVTDAVENGWSRFAFTGYNSSPTPPRSSARGLLGLCAVGDLRRDSEPEMSWEICHDSADFMQKIRLNPGLRKPLNANNGNGIISVNNNNNGASLTALSVITTALPLPGPPVGKSSSFPQEAYFEFTVLYCRGGGGEERDQSGGNRVRAKEGERTKLIQESSNAMANSESLVHFGPKVEELKIGGKDEGKGGGGGGGGGGGDGAAMLSVGLTAGGSLPLKLPGSYPGSIGFNSDGSVYVDGSKLAFASEKAEWGRADKVIGCGFDPKQKKVFFTVDSEVIHLVHCKSEEFGTPLYPTLAANSDVLVLVNFGQSIFKYTPANAQRTPNPCFLGSLANSPAATIGYDDSKELFSMGRIDSQWLNRCTARGSQNLGNPNRALDFDEESEADLFEIVLDSCGRSPNVVS